MLYQCTVQVYLELPNNTETTIQVPTFLLDSDIQGITSVDHARRIAADMFHSVLTGRPSLTFVDVVEYPQSPLATPEPEGQPTGSPRCRECGEETDGRASEPTGDGGRIHVSCIEDRLDEEIPPRTPSPYEVAGVGAIVQLYPDADGESGPSPDDRYAPPGAIARVESIERHPNNEDFIWSMTLRLLEEGETVKLRYQASARSGARPLGSIHRVLVDAPVEVEADEDAYPDCPICGEPIDHCAGHGAHNLCEPGEPCEACAVEGHAADDCPAS